MCRGSVCVHGTDKGDKLIRRKWKCRRRRRIVIYYSVVALMNSILPKYYVRIEKNTGHEILDWCKFSGRHRIYGQTKTKAS